MMTERGRKGHHQTLFFRDLQRQPQPDKSEYLLYIFFHHLYSPAEWKWAISEMKKSFNEEDILLTIETRLLQKGEENSRHANNGTTDFTSVFQVYLSETEINENISSVTAGKTVFTPTSA